MDYSGFTDQELVGLARGGDGRAFVQVVERNVRPALAVAWEFTETLEDAEDVVQEAFRHWDGLTDRIVADTVPLLVARRGPAEWWSGMSRFSTALATGALAATIAAVSLLPAVPSDALATEQVEDALGIAPDHALTILMSEAPPRMETLVLNTTENER